MAPLLELAQLFVDASLIITSTYFVIAGITHPKSLAPPPSSAERTAPPTDLISRLRITQLERILPLLFIGLAFVQGRAIDAATLRDDAPPLTQWIESGDRGRFRLAAVVAAVGGALRLWCYKTLGDWFTFDLATRKGQKVSCTATSEREAEQLRSAHGTLKGAAEVEHKPRQLDWASTLSQLLGAAQRAPRSERKLVVQSPRSMTAEPLSQPRRDAHLGPTLVGADSASHRLIPSQAECKFAFERWFGWFWSLRRCADGSQNRSDGHSRTILPHRSEEMRR